MGDLHRRGRIELSDDPKFSRTSWKVERIGWWTLGAVLVAGTVGLLGPGLFSAASAGEPGDPIRVEYERFGHFETDDELRIRLRPRDGTASMWIEDRYLDGVEIRDVFPPPERVELREGRKVYIFSAGAGHDPVQVRFDVTYKKIGRLAGRLGTSDGPAVDVKQFIYP